MKQLTHQPAAMAPIAPSAADRVLPAVRQSDRVSDATACRPLGELLETVDRIDRLQARAIELTARLQLSGEDLEQTGLPADVWLAVEGRMTRCDRRMLAAVAAHLSRLPGTGREFANGGLSWSQVRTLTSILLRHRPRADQWERFDNAIVCAVGQADADEPDEVIRIFERWLWTLRPDVIADAEADVANTRFLAIQPRLDGTGGRFWGDTDALGLALLDGTTAPTPDQLGDDDEGLTPVGKVGRTRHDNLMHRLAASDGDGTARVEVLLRVDYDTLVGLSNSHADLLVTLTGGQLKVSAPTARRLIADGFDNRLIALDTTGQVLGVGRRTRVPPDWLRDALLARDTTCTHPGCTRAGRTCHADHARPWPRGGATDSNNLALVCGPHNRAKEPTGWKVKGHPDGSRTWHHPRTGLTIRTTPSTRRIQPPNPPPPPASQAMPTARQWPSPPAGADPPTHD